MSLRHDKLHPVISFIRSCKAVCHELKGLIEVLVLLAFGVWGLLHFVQILFVKVR
jgi:hypothetical protein